MTEKEKLSTLELFKSMLEVNLSLVNKIDSSLTTEEKDAIMYHLIKNMHNTTKEILENINLTES